MSTTSVTGGLAEPGSIIHQVAMRFAPEATPEQRDATLAALAAFREHALTLPGVLGFVLGTDLALREGNFDFGLVVNCASVEAYQAYSADAVHQEFIAQHIVPVVAERAAVQYEVK